MSQPFAPHPSSGLRLLSLDGGGIRGLSELVILGEIMAGIQENDYLAEPGKVPYPCQYFDLIGGTSTGGLIALLLGRLRLSVEDATRLYAEMVRQVFSEQKFRCQEGKFKATKLEEALKHIVMSSTGDPHAPMLDPGPEACKTFVCAAAANNISSATPHLFRTYTVSHNATDDCCIWEAARATSASPTFFKKMLVGRPNMQEAFVDAGSIGCNNPIQVVLQEAKLAFPN
ncbi:hypothetical protein JAAARDRAFT_200086 [Jaapia argillacea MUCL 33604]|uniref:PNPLA domain-containing protein n=1 Tax=Jaapia argillacea MUCL 33604 TaxID=933084 RepID=A0A067PIL9_9AGAM|nr:hypothetical protein JAAARDRAFT_200086 [Jaapia argillacea MUCL 33604]